MLARTSTLVSLLAITLLAAGCASENWVEDEGGSDSALTGKVTVGRVVQTVTEGLRLRRTPSRENTNNIIGLIPTGSNVKIVDGTPTDGFYKIEVIDKKVRDALEADIGWVYGEYLNGDAEEPPADPDQSLTGTWDVASEVRVNFKISDCKGLKDDQGKPMAPTIDDVLEKGTSSYAVLAIDTNTYSYGMKAKIKEVDQKSSFNPGGKPVKFKIVKTAKTQPQDGFTVTICGRPESAMTLPTDNGLLNLSVYAYQ
jgi:hypothetical protein